LQQGGEVPTEVGFCWNTSPNPTPSNNKIVSTLRTDSSMIDEIFNLKPGTTYYVRAYAINSRGIGYSNELTITTKVLFTPGKGVKDILGNSYKTVVIGTQEWMAENLRTIVFNDGTKITNGTLAEFKAAKTEPYWCYYQDKSTYDATYGKLYNWYVVNNSKNVCPTGWHVPTAEDFLKMQSYLGGVTAGGRLKDVGTTNWVSPNTLATNESGFTAQPAGERSITAGDQKLGIMAGIWINQEYSQGGSAYYRQLNYNDRYVMGLIANKSNGLSVRCVKD
jgi:uncharacterized protein (TIGR02145 family)